MQHRPDIPEAFKKGLPESIDAKSLIEALQSPTPTSIRFNPLKHHPAFSGKQIPWEPLGLYLTERPVFTLDPLLHSGSYYVQEAGSMFIGQILRSLGLNTVPIRALDLCAAPGGKSSHLLSLLHPEGLLVANEYDRDRAKILAENLTKWGNSNFMITSADGAFFGSMKDSFDLVLLDAPCSGEGMFRKDDFARKQWSPKLVDQCCTVQSSLIKEAWKALKPGGYLIYSTCTFNRTENEFLVERHLPVNEIEPVKLPAPDSSWGIVTEENKWGPSFRFFPHLSQSEGFSVTTIKKREAATPPNKTGKQKGQVISSKEFGSLNAWKQDWDRENLFKRNDQIYIQSTGDNAFASCLAATKECLLPGLPVAEWKGKGFNPDFGLAMWNGLNSDAFPKIDLPLDQSLAYQKGLSDFEITGMKGWNLISFQGQPLGWIKHLGNRFNNYFPKPYRIRMQIKQ
jgi:16S rRNA C967 or C1407 C5-methylase (RsmB/RsmF family)/NOL1/NOP2/fmu family ribosome biogenesis protein